MRVELNTKISYGQLYSIERYMLDNYTTPTSGDAIQIEISLSTYEKVKPVGIIEVNTGTRWVGCGSFVVKDNNVASVVFQGIGSSAFTVSGAYIRVLYLRLS